MKDIIPDPYYESIIGNRNSNDDSNHIKSNDMVFAPLDLSPRMCDVLAMLFTRMRAEDWFVDRDLDRAIPAQPRYTFTSKEISEFLGMEAKHVATLLKVPSKKLAELTAGIESEDGNFVYAPLFAKIEYKNRQYTIVPNNELRESYIAKAKNNGYALINNAQYVSLPDANSKKLLDLLSRFKSGNKLYAQTLSQLQRTFGVIGPDNELKKKSYKTLGRFISLVIEPSLERIASSPESKDRIRLLYGSSGKLGYEIVKGGSEPKVKFCYEWMNCFSEEEISKASLTIESLLQTQLKLQAKDQHLSLEQLYELKKCCEIVSTESEDMRSLISHIYSKALLMIEEAKSEMEKAQERNASDDERSSFKSRMEIMIQKGLF